MFPEYHEQESIRPLREVDGEAYTEICSEASILTLMSERNCNSRPTLSESTDEAQYT